MDNTGIMISSIPSTLVFRINMMTWSKSIYEMYHDMSLKLNQYMVPIYRFHPVILIWQYITFKFALDDIFAQFLGQLLSFCFTIWNKINSFKSIIFFWFD